LCKKIYKINIDNLFLCVLFLIKQVVNFYSFCFFSNNLNTLFPFLRGMIREIPILKEKIDIEYENIELEENSKKYGKLSPPIVLINGTIFSEGQIPIIKKLSSELFKVVK